MGIGGVLAMGCTAGTSSLTMKIQYYKMAYEKEGGFGKVLVASLAGRKLLANGMRKLDNV